METASWTYFIILGLSILYPVAQSFEKRVYMYRKMKFIFPGVFFSGFLFIVWDIFFTKYGIWGFNHSYTRDFYIAGLPVEEWLFFLVVPYCLFFTYEVLRFFVKRFYYPVFSKVFIIVLLVVLAGSIPFIYQRTYTITAFAFAVPFLVLQLVLKTYRTWFSGFILMYLVAFVPFIIVNGFLTRIPVVWYNNAENLAIRITTIPVEDFIYLLGMLLPAFTIYQLLLHRYASPKLRADMKLDEVTGF
jgi:lycopene cyclase domain-containing protein